MFMAKLNLSITDYAVSRGILELQDEYHLITHDMIAERIHGERTAVWRSIKNLKDAGLLIIVDGSARSGGHRYEYLGE